MQVSQEVQRTMDPSSASVPSQSHPPFSIGNDKHVWDGATGRYRVVSPTPGSPSNPGVTSETNARANPRSRNRTSTMADLASMNEIPESVKEEFLAVLNYFEKKSWTKNDLLKALTGAYLEMKYISVQSEQQAEDFRKHWSEREAFWNQSWVEREEKHDHFIGQLKRENFDSQQDSKNQTQKAFQAHTQLKEALESGKSLVKAAQVLESKVEELQGKVEAGVELEEKLSKVQQKLVDYEAKNNSKQAELATSEIKNSDLQPTLEGEGEEVVQSIKCEDCHKVFSTRKLLQDHVKKSHKKDLKCSLCDLVFLYKSKLDRHRLVHTTETQFKCDVCGKKFNQKFNLKSHASVHTDVKLFPCLECNQSFSRKNYLKKHMGKCHK